jgi:sulfofructose kinase
MTARVVCLGIAVRDYVFQVDTLPTTPQKISAHGFVQSQGGMAATAAVAVAQLGGEAEFWGRLGDDATGQSMRADLLRFGVAVGLPAIAGGQSPVAVVILDALGERMLAVFPGAGFGNDLSIPIDSLDSKDAVHADSRWPQGAEKLFQAASNLGLPRVFDADVGDPASIQALIPLADHVIFSEIGLKNFSPQENIEFSLYEAQEMNRAVVGATFGEHGSVFLIDQKVYKIPALKVSAKDTNGAGDVFHGAYALAMGEGKDPLEAARFATVAAALKCQNGSGWTNIPERSTVNQLLKEYKWHR